MNYLLDTNAVIALLTNRPPTVRARLRRALARRGNSVALSSIVLHELWHGVACSDRPRENAERLRVFLSGNIGVVAFTEEDAIVAGELRAVLARVGSPIGPYDLLIAGQALRDQSTLVTANVSEFARVRGLRWQDWSSGARPASR